MTLALFDRGRSTEGHIEITLTDRVRLAIRGPVTGERIAQVLAALRR